MKILRRRLTQFASTLILSSLIALPLQAADPFRTQNPREIGDRTEAAFETLFVEGDYPAARQQLIQAEQEDPQEPLVYALRAALAHTEGDFDTLEDYSKKTLDAAEDLLEEDPLRGNLYLAIGTFLEGAYQYEQQGPIVVVPRLQEMFTYLDKAEAIDPDDPELNLIQGYINLLLSLNFPFAEPEQAIAQLQQYGAPEYLVERGVAIAYRDLEQLNDALTYADRALQATPNNPELYYLKGQILRKIAQQTEDLSTYQQALQHFDLAMAKSNQLPESVTETLEREHRKTQETINQMTQLP